MNKITQKQFKLILDLFSNANKNKKLIFILGGWNIDLSYGKITREHADVDFLFDINDYKYWKEWFLALGFKEKKVDAYYSVYSSSRKDLSVDMEGFNYDKELQVIAWKDGRTSPINEVVEMKKYNRLEFTGMKLSVEKHLKYNHKDYGKRKKDLHDVKLLEKLLRLK